MNTSNERERLKKTTIVYLVVMVLIVVLILLTIQDTQIKTIASVLVLLVGAAAIIVQWMLVGKKPSTETTAPPVEQKPVQKAPPKPVEKPKPAPPKVEEAEEGPSTRTGSPCESSGTYHCSEHPDKQVSMEEGKRFPPCRGDNKGHSALWVLES